MKNRIREIRIEAELTQEEFAKRINLTKNFISLIENGARNLSERSVIDICREFNVNYDWIKFGKGSKYKTEKIIDQLSKLFNSVAHEPNYSFRKSVFLNLTKLDPKDWEPLREIAEKVLDKKE